MKQLFKIWIFILGGLSILIACSKDETTSYTISDDQFVKVLADIHISEASISHLAISLKDSMANVYLDQILDLHNVQKDVFLKEYQVLKLDPEKVNFIYTKVIKRLSDLKLEKDIIERNDREGKKGQK